MHAVGPGFTQAPWSRYFSLECLLNPTAFYHFIFVKEGSVIGRATTDPLGDRVTVSFQDVDIFQNTSSIELNASLVS